jgi:AcrR family transcriptional regulator
MLRAASDLFRERGYGGASMEQIAQRADVAVQTLYFTFNTKSSLLEETVGAAIVGFERWDPRTPAAVAADPRKALKEIHPWYRDFEGAASAQAALDVFIDSSMGIFERVAPLVLVQSAGAASDPQVKAAAQLAEERRVEGYKFVVESLARRGKFRRGMDVRRATDVLLTILSAQTYWHLTDGRAWSEKECRRWFGEVLKSQLFE